MVFLIHADRDAKQLTWNLTELIQELKSAPNELIDLEELADEDLTSR